MYPDYPEDISDLERAFLEERDAREEAERNEQRAATLAVWALLQCARLKPRALSRGELEEMIRQGEPWVPAEGGIVDVED